MKQLQYLVLLALFFAATVLSSACQSPNNFPGVYAGVKLSLNPLGGAMNRTDVVILLRKDKTFTDQLNKKDWKTAVRGKYAIKGSDLILHYTNGDKDEYTITKGGNLDAGTFVLFKMNLDNSIPKGSYEFKFISGSGGISTGTTYVGSSAKKILRFDGAGNFDTDKQSVTIISGDNIGGGTNSTSAGKGKYILKDGVLSLKYDNGATTTHSFFASAGDAKSKTMAVIDGSFYFMGNDSKEETNDPKTSANNKKMPNATEIFQGLRKNYGGTALDELRNYVVHAEVNGIKLVSYNDLSHNKSRNEMFHKGKLIAIEQFDQTGGWMWNNGKKTISDKSRLMEISYNDYVGVLGLRKQNSMVFGKGKVLATKDGYSVEFDVDQHHFIYLIDKNYNLLGDGYQIGTKRQTNRYSNNKVIDGIKMPFNTISSDGKNKVNITYKTIDTNKPLNTNWQGL